MDLLHRLFFVCSCVCVRERDRHTGKLPVIWDCTKFFELLVALILTVQSYTLLCLRNCLQKTGWCSRLHFHCCNVLKDHVTEIQKGKRCSTKGKIQNQICKHRKHPLGRTAHAMPFGELQCSLSHLLMYLSVGSKILIQITTDIFTRNAVQKESFGESYSASAGICCEFLMCCIG